MKTKITLLLLFISFAFFTGKAQQIPNGNFQSWTGNDPNDWYDIDQLLLAATTQQYYMVAKDSTPGNVINGNPSVMLQSASVPAAQGNLPGIIGTASLSLGGPTGIEVGKIPYAFRPDSVTFKFKYETVASDTALWNFALTKNGVFLGGVAAGYNYIITKTDSMWETFTVSPNWVSDSIPDSLSVIFFSGGNNTTPGNTLWINNVVMIFNSSGLNVDNLSINTTTSMGLFPVPASNMLNVKVSEAMLNNTYNVVDMNGKIVLHGVIEALTSKQDVSRLPVGTYIYTIVDGNNNTVDQAKFVVAR